MNTKHTAGPWELRGPCLVTDSHGVVIAEHISANYPGTPEANASLIAAAPELLTALQEITSAYDRLLQAYGKPFEWGTIESDNARAVIAKATGN